MAAETTRVRPPLDPETLEQRADWIRARPFQDESDYATAAILDEAAAALREQDRELTFAHALDIARGCADYNGGYSGDERTEFLHGVQTVVRALEAADVRDTQTQALMQMGRATLTPEDSNAAR
jgi:hypothetical protein